MSESSSTISLVKEESKTVNQDIGADNSRVVADGKGKAENAELKKEENIVENDNKDNKSGVLEENEKPVEGVALDDKKLSEKTKEETVGGKELTQETRIETVSKGETKEDALELEDKKLGEEKKQGTGI